MPQPEPVDEQLHFIAGLKATHGIGDSVRMVPVVDLGTSEASIDVLPSVTTHCDSCGGELNALPHKTFDTWHHLFCFTCNEDKGLVHGAILKPKKEEPALAGPASAGPHTITLDQEEA